MTVLGRHAAAIPALTAVLVLSACALSGPPLARQGAGTAAPPSAAGSATPFPAPAEAAAPAAAPPPYLPPPKQFHLGAAASALVTQAHRQAAGGDYGQAVATLERAQRIEPDNPLVWIELGRLQLGANNGAQADAMARKALSLATGDPAAQSAAWQLLADSLRARGRNAEAADADHRAAALLTH
jgi:tetratricopeptide (TPR) repeat protein